MIRFALLLAALAFSGQVGAKPQFDGFADTYIEVLDQVYCYPQGLDLMSAGDRDAGMALWSQCYDESLVSNLNFGSGPIVCPGKECPLNQFAPDLRGAQMRAMLALSGYERAGFIATHHQLTSIRISFDTPERAQVVGHMQATHFKADAPAVVGFGRWSGTLEKKAVGWRITAETYVPFGSGALPKPSW